MRSAWCRSLGEWRVVLDNCLIISTNYSIVRLLFTVITARYLGIISQLPRQNTMKIRDTVDWLMFLYAKASPVTVLTVI